MQKARHGPDPLGGQPSASGLQRRRLPLLLERLTDNAPALAIEDDEKREPSAQRLQKSVLMNLQELLNCTRPAWRDTLPGASPLSRSTLNFGMPALAGKVITETGWRDIARSIKTAIICFEPRILAAGLTVSDYPQHAASLPNVLSFVIQGSLCWAPAPLDFVFYSHVDLETGRCKLTEQG